MDEKYFTPVFMGSGDYSLAECYMLHRKLEEIINMMSGLQQPSHAESEAEAAADERQYERDTRKLKIYVLQLVSKLGFTLEELMELELYQDMLDHNKSIDEKNKVSD